MKKRIEAYENAELLADAYFAGQIDEAGIMEKLMEIPVVDMVAIEKKLILEGILDAKS